MKRASLLLLSLLTATSTYAQIHASTKPHIDLTMPALRSNDPKYLQLHEEFVARAKQGDIGLLFLGDSITAGWATRGKDVFAREYEQYKPANFGIGGDHVNGVLWRVEHGELDNISPKVLVLLIGTNDTGSNTASDIASGVEHLVYAINQKLPNTKILLLAIFPRGPHKAKDGSFDDGTKKMEIIRAANQRLAKRDDGGKTVKFLDISDKFLEAGKIPDAIMSDQLHPTEKGYEIWADAMRPTLDALLKG